jgi:hypothetical protein
VLTPHEVATWINDIVGVPVPFLPGPQPRSPIAPDVVGIVMPSPGLAPDVDGLFEHQGFHLSVRGPQSRTYSEAAYQAALDLDVALRFWLVPCRIGRHFVTSIQRPGSPPQLVSPTPDPAERFTYTAAYLFHVSALPCDPPPPL